MDERPPPDLSSREGRMAYRRELRGVARGWRLGGLGLLVSAFALLVYAPQARTAAIALFVLSWAAMIVGIVQRTRYHKRRMAGQKL